MKRIKNLIISMLAVVLLVGMTSFALGASVNTSIVPEKSKVKAGETFTVTVKFSGGDVGRVKALMDYNSTKLSYLKILLRLLKMFPSSLKRLITSG